jgi:hypothetical protein
LLMDEKFERERFEIEEGKEFEPLKWVPES